MKTVLILTFVILNLQLVYCQTSIEIIRFSTMYFHLDSASLHIAPAHFNVQFQSFISKPGIEVEKTSYGYRYTYKGLTVRNYFFTDNFFLEQIIGRAWGNEIESVISERISFRTASGIRNVFNNHNMWQLKPFRDVGIKLNLSNK